MILTLIFIRTMDLLRVLNSYFQPGPLVQYVTMNSKDLRAYNADTFSVRTASLCGWTVNAPDLCVELLLPKIPSGRTAVLILLFSCFKIKLLFHLSMPTRWCFSFPDLDYLHFVVPITLYHIK